MADDTDPTEGDGGPGGGPAGGVLSLVGTPIGNLGDLTPRAVEALAAADVVCCEDTRRTGRLLQHAGVRANRLLVVNEHTERRVVAEVLDLLASGRRVALVSDAGMPGLSDPGELLVAEAAAAGHPVEVVPGPSAAISALVLSGLPTRRFVFEGFLPRKGAERTERLQALAAEPRTLVLYEAPHRVARTLADLASALGPDRRVALARELTKLHEEVWRGTLGGAAEHVAEQPPQGEFVLVVDGAPPAPEADDDTLRAALQQARDEGASTRDAVAEVARRHGVSKRRVYVLATGG